MVLSNRAFFCIVLHAIGTARLSLSTEDIELPGVIQKSLNVTAMRPSQRTIELEGLDQNAQARGRNDHEHVNIPQGLEESKHEMERIIKERNEIVYLTDHLRPSCQEELFLGVELDHLIRASGHPRRKLRQLGAMEPFHRARFHGLNKMSADSREPVDTTSQTSRSSRRATKGRKLSILKSHWKTLTSYKPYARRAGSRDNPVLQRFDRLELLISTDEPTSRLTFKPLLADKSKKQKQYLKLFCGKKNSNW
ncbi:hypothetical protein PSHT_03478, partial [Puccinia striiformis]